MPKWLDEDKELANRGFLPMVFGPNSIIVPEFTPVHVALRRAHAHIEELRASLDQYNKAMSNGHLNPTYAGWRGFALDEAQKTADAIMRRDDPPEVK